MHVFRLSLGKAWTTWSVRHGPHGQSLSQTHSKHTTKSPQIINFLSLKEKRNTQKNILFDPRSIKVFN